MTKAEIQAEINSAQSDLNDLNEVIETRGMLNASELKNIVDSMNNRYKALLTHINENTLNEEDFTPTTDTNLFLVQHMDLNQDVEHNLALHQFAFSSKDSENDYRMFFKIFKNTFSFLSTDYAETFDNRTELGVNLGRLTLRGQQEQYYSKAVYNSVSTGVSLQNASYTGNWTTRLGSNRIYVIDCYVTGIYNRPGEYLAYSGRLKASMIKDPTSGNAVFFPASYITEESVFDPNTISPVMSSRLALAGDKVTLELRNNKVDIPTIWRYEIQLRVL